MFSIHDYHKKPVPANNTGIVVSIGPRPKLGPGLGPGLGPELGPEPALPILDNTSIVQTAQMPLSRQERQKILDTLSTRKKQIRTRAPVSHSLLSTDIEPEKAVDPEFLALDLDPAIADFAERVSDEPVNNTRILASSYYMNNRKRFISNFNSIFKAYQETGTTATPPSCDAREESDNMTLSISQEIVRDYLNVYSPYRGLLLFHGLGAGKTCAAIGIAEGFKSLRKIYVLTPASLKDNFFSEIRKCGDQVYTRAQHWKFVPCDVREAEIVAAAISVPPEFIARRHGVWLCDATQPPNFAGLSAAEKQAIDDQIDAMIRSKYLAISYNGLDSRAVNTLTRDGEINPFDHSVVIIDEAHNFVSAIVNRLREKTPKDSPDHFRIVLYKLLMGATNARIVMLSGTPIINSPHEIATMFNMLRGYIKTWTFSAKPRAGKRVSSDDVRTMLESGDTAAASVFDFVDYRNEKVIITRNPYGFVNAKEPQTPISIAALSRRRKTRKLTIEKAKAEPEPKPEPEPEIESAKDTISTEPAPLLLDQAPISEKFPGITTDFKNIAEEEFGIEPKPRTRTTRKKKTDTDTEFDNTSKMSGGVASFAPVYYGVELDESGNIDDAEFVSGIHQILERNGLIVAPIAQVQATNYTCLPDTQEEFANIFLNANADKLVNAAVLKKRIFGLTSYFRSAQEQLLPTIIYGENKSQYHFVRVEMSEYQFGVYVKARHDEETKAKNARKRASVSKTDDVDVEAASAYRINSRAACNFAFPATIEKPSLDKSRAKVSSIDIVAEMDTEAGPVEDANYGEDIDADAAVNREAEESRDDKILRVLNELSVPEFLGQAALPELSPKFAAIVDGVCDPERIGLHLLYSQFCTLEGIGILRRIFIQRGFAEFELTKEEGEWSIVSRPEDAGKPRFAVYTGEIKADVKELIRHVYNNTWNELPVKLAEQLRASSPEEGNLYGSAIKLLMISASGAEGINLRNTRFVHITEPYWHMVRLEQVVGRARRICSHAALPEKLRTVQAFVYVSVLSPAQTKTNASTELRLKDVSRHNENMVISTDETLLEGAIAKNVINQQLLRCLKETSIECSIYKDTNSAEELDCFTFGDIKTNGFAFSPILADDMEEKHATATEAVQYREVSAGGVSYMMDIVSKYIYSRESFEAYKSSGTIASLEYKGRVVEKDGRTGIELSTIPPMLAP